MAESRGRMSTAKRFAMLETAERAPERRGCVPRSRALALVNLAR